MQENQLIQKGSEEEKGLKIEFNQYLEKALDGEIIKIGKDDICFNIYTKDNSWLFIWKNKDWDWHQSTEIQNRTLPYCNADVIEHDDDTPKHVYISNIYVPEEARGKRIATKLLQSVEKKCINDGISLIKLENSTDPDKVTQTPSMVYEYAGYHYIYPIEKKIQIGDKYVTKPTDGAMEKVLPGGIHSDCCVFHELEKKNYTNDDLIIKPRRTKQEKQEKLSIIKKHCYNLRSKCILKCNHMLRRSARSTAKNPNGNETEMEEMEFSRKKPSKRKSNRKSKRKSKRTSKRKSKRTSKRKSKRTSKTKHKRKSKRKSKRTSKRKSKRTSKRKSKRTSKRKQKRSR